MCWEEGDANAFVSAANAFALNNPILTRNRLFGQIYKCNSPFSQIPQMQPSLDQIPKYLAALL